MQVGQESLQRWGLHNLLGHLSLDGLRRKAVPRGRPGGRSQALSGRSSPVPLPTSTCGSRPVCGVVAATQQAPTAWPQSLDGMHAFPFLFFFSKLLINSLKIRVRFMLRGGLQVHICVFLLFQMVSLLHTSADTLEELHVEIPEPLLWKKGNRKKGNSSLSGSKVSCLKRLGEAHRPIIAAWFCSSEENFTHCSAVTRVESMMLHQHRKKFVPVTTHF